MEMVSERTKNFLKELGLTEYETRAYVSLVSSGTSTAGDLSEVSGVPHSRIYDVLSKLERRGWVESQSGRPARYRAKPPSEVLRLVKLRREEKFKEASETIRQELEPLYKEGGEVEKPNVWVIHGNQEILGRMEQMFTRAEIRVLISLPYFPEEFSHFKDFIPLLETKNLDIRILTSEENEFTQELESHPDLEVGFREPLFGGGIIVDGKEVLLVLESGGRRVGIWSDEAGLAKYAQEYFEYLWRDSEVSSN